MKLLVLGATGMLGNAVLRLFASRPGVEAVGSARSGAQLRHLPPEVAVRVVTGVEVENLDALIRLLGEVQPDVVTNCVGSSNSLPMQTTHLPPFP